MFISVLIFLWWKAYILDMLVILMKNNKENKEMQYSGLGKDKDVLVFIL